MPIRWVVADLVEGDLLAELPLASNSVQRAISTEGSATWTFDPTDKRTPKGWAHLLVPGKVMIVAVLDGRPLQAWPLTQPVIGSSNPVLGGPTMEGLLTRVFVREYEAYGVDEAFICQEIAEQVFAPGFNFTTTAYESGVVRDAYYDGTSDLTIRALLDEYASSEPPISFTCDIGWVPGQEWAKFRKGLRIGANIGDVTSTIFDSKSIVSYERPTSFSEGSGATRLWTVADGSGDARPMEGPFESDRIAEWGPWESRVSFETAQDEETLRARGRTTIAERQFGTTTWSFVLDLERAPKVGIDWDIGSTVSFVVEPSDTDPIGGSHTGEILGYELDTAANTIIPTLKQNGGDAL